MKTRLACVPIVAGILLLGGCAAREDAKESAATLVLVTPDEEILENGEVERVPILIARQGFVGPVNIEVGQLPAGVELVDTNLVVQPDAKRLVLALKVHPDAKPVRDFPMTVRATAANMPEIIETMRLTVVEEPTLGTLPGHTR